LIGAAISPGFRFAHPGYRRAWINHSAVTKFHPNRMRKVHAENKEPKPDESGFG
jgi:hypothetical protein